MAVDFGGGSTRSKERASVVLAQSSNRLLIASRRNV